MERSMMPEDRSIRVRPPIEVDRICRDDMRALRAILAHDSEDEMRTDIGAIVL